jgi:hypothetical protein
MGAPAEDVLLDVWEEGIDATPTRRALGLLGAAHPGLGSAELADLSLGERNVALLRLRTQLFGDRVEAIGACPACGAELDIAFDVSDLLASLPATDTDGPMEVVVDGYTALVRPPTSADMLAVLEGEATHDVGAQLLGSCVTRVTGPDQKAHAGVPEPVAARLAEEITRRDSGAEIDLALECAECGHRWPEALDVAGFVWAEVNAWARRTVREVHALARAYGWSEGDILALTARRRAAYLRLVTG